MPKSRSKATATSPPPPRLSNKARAVHKALAGRDQVTWKDVRDLGFDHIEVARIWNELIDAGLAEGRISHAEPGRVFSLH